MKPKVAVITRTKDRPLFLQRALKSVHAQTMQDFAHVIVNDGGDKGAVDGAVAHLTDAQRKKTVVYHRDTPSNAPDTIFNESVDRAHSEYFVIHDDDDTWHEDFLAHTVMHLDDRPELGAVVTRADKVIEKLTADSIKEVGRSHWMSDIRVVSLYRQCIDNQLTPIATVFRRSAYEAVGKFDDKLPVVGDWEFGVRLLMRYDVDFLDPGFALAYYHHRKQADNSFTVHNHRYYVNRVMNEYLRRELSEGRLGVGYIMSQLKYSQGWTASLIRRVLPDFAVSRLKKRISE